MVSSEKWTQRLAPTGNTPTHRSITELPPAEGVPISHETTLKGRATSAIYYERDGYDTSRKKLMGRHVAGASFLTAMARHAASSGLIAVAPDADHFADFEAHVRAANPSRSAHWVPATEPEALREIGCMFYPGIPPADWAWMRRREGQRAFSLCGITHTTASERAMMALGDLVTAPYQSWDALICTSRAVHEMVERVFDEYCDYFLLRFGARNTTRPQRPIIPLGVDCEAFDPTEAARRRGQALRARLRIPERTFVVLFVGRLSYHGKAHPLPLYLSLERCMKSSRVPICLLLAGWFANQSIRKQFTEAARMLCPSVPVVVADGRIPEVQRDVWHAADVFASPSDNIQETFGLTPVEAMAAGLPSVISDWNGYRDGPRDGAEGFLVPSWLAPAGTGEEIARRHHVKLDDYDHYIANTGQFAAVEVAPMARAFETLISRPELRREMGERARRRAVSVYDWSVIIPQYEELWTELAARRAVDAESAPVRHSGSPTPHHADPFTLFAGYASERLNGRTLVSLRPGTDAERMRERTSLFMNALARNLACDVDTIDAIFLELCDGRELRAADLLEAVDFADRRTALRTLVWLTKLDLVQLRDPDS